MRARGTGGMRVAFLSQGIASGGNFLLAVLLVRALGLEDFGVLSLVLIGVGYAVGMGQALVCQPMLSLAPQVELSERAGRVRDAVWMAVGLAAVTGLVAMLVLACLDSYGVSLGDSVGGSMGDAAGWVAALAGLRLLAPVLRGALFTLGRGRSTVAMDAIAGWGPCAGVLGLGFMGGASVQLALHVLTVSAGAAAAFGLLALRDLGIGGLPRRAALARHWQSGRWLAGNQVLSWFGTGGLHAATAAVLGPAAVGAIRAAQSLVGVLLVACQALELSLPGKAAQALGSGGQAGLVRWSRACAWKLGLGFAVLGGGLGLLGSSLSRWVFPEVDPGLVALALAGLVWLPLASVVAGVLQIAFRALEDTRPVFVAYAVSSLASAALALPVVQTFGLEGAAWGFTGTQGLFALLLGLGMALRASSGTPSGLAMSVPPIGRSVSIRHS